MTPPTHDHHLPEFYPLPTHSGLMSDNLPNIEERLQKLLRYAGEEKILEYRSEVRTMCICKPHHCISTPVFYNLQTIPPELYEIDPEAYSIEAAIEWISYKPFAQWLGRQGQQRNLSAPPPTPSRNHHPIAIVSTPSTAAHVEHLGPTAPSSPAAPPTSPPSSAATPVHRKIPQPSFQGAASTPQHEVIELSSDSEDDDPRSSSVLPTTPTHRPLKRKGRSSDPSLSPIKEEPATSVLPPTKIPRGGKFKITRQCQVDKLVTLTKLPEYCWSIPRSGETVAYLLDLSDDKREWKHEDGSEMSMASIIKSQVSV